MSTSFQSYLNEIARYPLLTVDQEIQFGRRIAKMRELQQLERILTDAEQRWCAAVNVPVSGLCNATYS
jgi:hypothetical protein